MFLASIDDEFFKCDTRQELDDEIQEHLDYNLNQGETLEIIYYEPSVTKTVTLDFIWTTKGEAKEKPVPKNARAALDI